MSDDRAPPARDAKRMDQPTELGIAARRRTLLRAIAALALLAIVGLVWAWQKERVRAFARGEIDLSGEPRYEPPHPPDPEALARIDQARVHGQLIPAWTIALARATTPSGRRYADVMLADLEEAVAPDPNLASLLRSTHRALREDPLEHVARLDYLLWAYNHYLDRQAVPWRVEASLVLGEERAFVRMLTYEVMADARTARGHRLRMLRRADRTNAVEGWLGHTVRDDGAFVILARVLHFTVRHVWPGLHPALDARRPAAERPWLGEVRREVRAALGGETFELLAQSAVDQQALIEVADSVAARAECGSRFRIHDLPYNGLSRRGRDAIERALARSRTPEGDVAECPDITLDEAARIVGASERLASTDGLMEAVERLIMVVARSVAVHELQHAEDGEEAECPGCPKWLVGLPRAEVSAYLSAMSTEGLGYLALLQACVTPRGNDLHGRSLEVVLEAILPLGCEGPTRWDLYVYAERIETRLFGKRGDIALPELPDRVPLLPRANAARPRPAWRPLDTGWGVAVAAQEEPRESRAQDALTP